jgi:hypothetical protein
MAEKSNGNHTWLDLCHLRWVVEGFGCIRFFSGRSGKIGKPIKINGLKTTASVTIIVIVTLCLGALFVEGQTKIIRRALDELIYDSRNHYLPCDKLPTEAEVNRVVQKHQNRIEAIERVNPGLVGVEIEPSCIGKADLLIWYAPHANRLEIEKIIGGDTFFGIPYRLNNQ